jgi:hypothetical protein
LITKWTKIGDATPDIVSGPFFGSDSAFQEDNEGRNLFFSGEFFRLAALTNLRSRRMSSFNGRGFGDFSVEGEKVKETMTQCRRIVGRTPCALIGVLFISL